MKALDLDIVKWIESSHGGNGGGGTDDEGGHDPGPRGGPNGGVWLQLSARPLILDFLKKKVAEINAASGEEQQQLIEAFPAVFRDALVDAESPAQHGD